MWRLLTAATLVAASTKEDDRVTSIPGFEEQFQQGLGFEVYSGYLDVTVPKASTGYDALQIHYELHTCRADDCPLALWHQGGPGGSAVFGAWTEMGPFQLMAQGPVYDGANAWNQAAHMLYLESPAGSTIADQTGYSTCSIDGTVQDACKWTDVTQAVAYAHTIEAFLAKFPEYQGAPLYLTGESYAGQYVPNIAYHVLQSSYSFTITGLAVGNGCANTPSGPSTCMWWSARETLSTRCPAQAGVARRRASSVMDRTQKKMILTSIMARACCPRSCTRRSRHRATGTKSRPRATKTTIASRCRWRRRRATRCSSRPRTPCVRPRPGAFYAAPTPSTRLTIDAT